MTLPKPLKPGIIGIVGGPAERDLWGTLGRLAELGYEGIEGSNLLDLSADAAPQTLRRLNELGLSLLTVSTNRQEVREDLDAVIARAAAARATRATVWWGPADDRDAVLADAEAYDRAGERLAREGVRLAYHHHDHEFLRSFAGARAFDLLAANTDPAHVGFVIDLAWAAVGGEDPAALVRRLGSRVTNLHVKDCVTASRDDGGKVPWTAVGTGCVPIAAGCAAASEVGVEWAVVEQDQLRHLDALETATASILNLKELGVVAAGPKTL